MSCRWVWVTFSCPSDRAECNIHIYVKYSIVSHVIINVFFKKKSYPYKCPNFEVLIEVPGIPAESSESFHRDFQEG